MEALAAQQIVFFGFLGVVDLGAGVRVEHFEFFAGDFVFMDAPLRGFGGYGGVEFPLSGLFGGFEKLVPCVLADERERLAGLLVFSVGVGLDGQGPFFEHLREGFVIAPEALADESGMRGVFDVFDESVVVVRAADGGQSRGPVGGGALVKAVALFGEGDKENGRAAVDGQSGEHACHGPGSHGVSPLSCWRWLFWDYRMFWGRVESGSDMRQPPRRRASGFVGGVRRERAVAWWVRVGRRGRWWDGAWAGGADQVWFGAGGRL